MAVDDLRDELDAFVLGDSDDDYESQPDETPPVPEDADGANRLLRRIRGFERLIDEAREVAFAELERIQKWYDDRTAGMRSQIAYNERSLEQWMRSEHAASGRKTVKLPNGEARVREAKARIAVHDEQATIVQFIESDQDAWVRFKREVDKVAMMKTVVPGARLDYNPNGEVAPEGYEWRQGLTLGRWEALGGGLIAWPSVTPVSNVAILTPTRPSFGYTTNKEQPR